jgi:hypothetical protein
VATGITEDALNWRPIEGGGGHERAANNLAGVNGERTRARLLPCTATPTSRPCHTSLRFQILRPACIASWAYLGGGCDLGYGLWVCMVERGRPDACPRIHCDGRGPRRVLAILHRTALPSHRHVRLVWFHRHPEGQKTVKKARPTVPQESTIMRRGRIEEESLHKRACRPRTASESEFKSCCCILACFKYQRS